MTVNHYEVLGVRNDAEHEAIRRAYRRLARLTHPDLGGDPTEFAAIAMAWAVLSDPAARAAHDAELDGDGDAWGVEVTLDEPSPTRSTEAESGAEPGPSAQDRPGGADVGANDEPLAGASRADVDGGDDDDIPPVVIDPFTSPPRVLPAPDTEGVVRHYPRWSAAWALYGYSGAVLLVAASAIAFPNHLPVSPTALIGHLVYSLALALSIAARAASVGHRWRSLSSAAATAVVLASYVLAAAEWIMTAPLPGEATRVIVVAGVASASLAAVVAVEARRSREQATLRALRAIHDAAAAARRWNALLDTRKSPGCRIRTARVLLPGRLRAQAGWAVVDGSGRVLAAAADADRRAWCDALRSAGVKIAPETAHT